MPGSDKDDGAAGFPDFGDAIDSATFGQILEMDDDDDGEKFSQSIVFGFFDQAEETFKEMDTAMADKDLEKLSQLGHFLKGSSATLGLVKVRDACEKIQRFGKCENIDGSPEPNKALCLDRIEQTLPVLRNDYADVEQTLRAYYGDSKT